MTSDPESLILLKHSLLSGHLQKNSTWNMPFGLTSTASRREAASAPLTSQGPKTKLKTSFGSKVAAPLKFKLSPPRSVLRPPSPFHANSKQKPQQQQQQQQQPQPHQQKSPSKIPTPTSKRSPPSKEYTSNSRPSGSPPSPSPSTPSESTKSKKSVIPTCASPRPDSRFALVSRDGRGRDLERQGTPPPPPGAGASPAPGLTRVPSRTQLRHASAARRLSAEGLLPVVVSSSSSSNFKLNNSSSSNLASRTAPDASPDGSERRNEDRNKTKPGLRVASPGPGPGPGPDSPRPASGRYKKQMEEPRSGRRPSWAGVPSMVDLTASIRRDGSGSFAPRDTRPVRSGTAATSSAGTRAGTLKRKEIDSAPDVDAVYANPPPPPPPLLRKSLEAAGVKVVADSSNMETLLNNRDFLQATYMTPQSVLDKIYHEDSYYHVWVATRLAMDEKPLYKHDLDEVVKLALDKFIVELGSALVDCLKPGLPLYTFVDPRRLMHMDGAKVVREQAIALVEGLEKKGVSRERVYVSIPATETGLAVSKRLREENGIQTNLVFVSGLTQAIACVGAAGAAAITMPFDKILGYHEELHATPYVSLNPHPGRQAIKATACYTKIHAHLPPLPHADAHAHQPSALPATSTEKEEEEKGRGEGKVQVIASSLRSVVELEHCSALDMVVLEDEEVERTLRWTRMRVNRPPGEGSVCWRMAREAHAHALASSEASKLADSDARVVPSRGVREDKEAETETETETESIRYLHTLSLAERNFTASVLHSGLRCWQDGVRLIEDVLRREVERCIEVYRGPLTCGGSDVGTETEGEGETEETEAGKGRGKGKGRIEFPRSIWEDDDGDEEVDENAFPTANPSPTPILGPSTPGPTHHQLHGYGMTSRAESSEPASVPQSPYWTDMDSFESDSELGDPGTGSSSDDDSGEGARTRRRKEDQDDMVLF